MAGSGSGLGVVGEGAELGLGSGSELVGSEVALGSASTASLHQVTLGYTITSDDVQRGVLALSATFHPSDAPSSTPPHDQFGLLSPNNYEPSHTVIKLPVARQVTPHPTHISLEWKAPSPIEYGTVLTGHPPSLLLYHPPPCPISSPSCRIYYHCLPHC